MEDFVSRFAHCLKLLSSFAGVLSIVERLKRASSVGTKKNSSPKIVFLADNLEGGAARLAEMILREWFRQSDRPAAEVVHAGFIDFPKDQKLMERIVPRFNFLVAHLRRCMIVAKLPSGTAVYNFTNFPIPSIFCLGKKQYVLLHNAYLIAFPEYVYGGYPVRAYWKESLKRLSFLTLLVLSGRAHYLVQSRWMEKHFQNVIQRICTWKKPSISVIPKHRLHEYSTDHSNSVLEKIPAEKFWYYPAALYPHKNHGFVLDVADQLKARRSLIRIVVTVSVESASGRDFWEQVKSRELDSVIINTGWISQEKSTTWLKNSRGLFFPSTFESLGLPLQEAIELEKPIIAALTEQNLDFLNNTAMMFDFREKNAAEQVAQMMMSESIFHTGSSEKPKKLSALEAYVLLPLGYRISSQNRTLDAPPSFSSID